MQWPECAEVVEARRAFKQHGIIGDDRPAFARRDGLVELQTIDADTPIEPTGRPL
jgi:hypothetical protein